MPKVQLHFSLKVVPVKKLIWVRKVDEDGVGHYYQELVNTGDTTTEVDVEFDGAINSSKAELPKSKELEEQTVARTEIVAEIPLQVASNPLTEFSFTLFDNRTGEEFLLSRNNGTPIKMFIVKGNDTAAQSRHPARPGFVWYGVGTEEFCFADLASTFDIDRTGFTLRFAQRDRTSPLLLTARVAVIATDEASGGDLGSGVTGILSSFEEKPVRAGRAGRKLSS